MNHYEERNQARIDYYNEQAAKATLYAVKQVKSIQPTGKE